MTHQNTKNRRAGAKFEADLVSYIRSRGLEADRLRLSGTADEGDIVIRDSVGVVAVCEAKAGTNLRVRHWWDNEAIPEARNYAARRSLLEPPAAALLMKSHNKSIGKALVTVSLDHYLDLLGGSA